MPDECCVPSDCHGMGIMAWASWHERHVWTGNPISKLLMTIGMEQLCKSSNLPSLAQINRPITRLKQIHHSPETDPFETNHQLLTVPLAGL